MEQVKTKYMNPYLAGVLLGLVLLASVYISSHGLGASGAIKSVIVSIVQVVAPDHAGDTKFYQEYTKTHTGSPLKSWLVFEVLGVIVGGFLSGLVSNRLMAIIGGILFGFGAQLARGCTSGAALSGMAVLSTAGFITMMTIFGTGYALAYFFRKLWI